MVFFYARFKNCQNSLMDREHLVLLRNLLNEPSGKLLLTFLQDYVTNQACKQREASEIKGMCELIQQLKDIPKRVEQKKE